MVLRVTMMLTIGKSKYSFRKNNQGFTLVEILLACLVLIIIAGLAIPSFNSQLGVSILKKDAMSLYQLMTDAYYKSVNSQEVLVVSFNQEQKKFMLHYDDDNSAQKRPIIKDITLSPEVELDKITKDKMFFYPSGFMEECRFILKHDKRRIVISTQESINHVDVFEI